jgi:hypothetical protein
MRTLAKYSFSAEGLSAEDVSSLEKRVTGLIEAWLKRKGATVPLGTGGSFRSKTRANNEGDFELQKHELEGCRLIDLRLEEFTNAEHIFETTVTTLSAGDRFDVFVKLASESTGSAVAPLVAHPKCPQIVRDLIQSSDRWTFQGQQVPRGVTRTAGEIDGLALADYIKSNSRVHPIIVVSELDNEELLPGLSEKLSYDLQGLAHVHCIDDDASWALSSRLGRINSCYLGAVRLYWPIAPGSEKIYSSVWTASKLLPADESQDQQALEKLANQLRQRVLGTSSEALTEPSAISRFRLKREKKRDEELAEQGVSAVQLDELLASKRDLETKLADAKATISRLYGQLQEAANREATESPTESPEAGTPDKPKPGEVRFYKKTHSKSNYDVLVPIPDCGHASWQNAAKADKAKKGIIRLEGSDDWSQVQHCGSCTGGGVWRVKW